MEDEQLQLALGMSASLNPPAAVAEDGRKSTGEMASCSAAECSVVGAVGDDAIHSPSAGSQSLEGEGQRPMVKKRKPLNSKGSK